MSAPGWNLKRYHELRNLPMATLVSMHIANGGLMARATYMTWTKEEIITEILEDESYAHLQRDQN